MVAYRNNAVKPPENKNVFNRAVGAVPSPIRRVVAGGLDALDTPRAAVMSTAKELRDLNNGQGFSPGDLVQQTRDNISASEALDLQRFGAWGQLGGLGLDLAVGIATTPGIGTVKAGGTGLFARGIRGHSLALARDAVERAVGENLGPSLLRVTGAGAKEADPLLARAVIQGSPKVKAAGEAASKLLVKGRGAIDSTTLADTFGRERALMLGPRAIPGTERLATTIDSALSKLLPKEGIVRAVTRQGANGAAEGFLQRLDSFGQTGSRLRAAAIEAVDTGDPTRFIVETQSTAVRGRAVGAGSVLAKEFLDGDTRSGKQGLRQIITGKMAPKPGDIDAALAGVRSSADRGATDLLAGLSSKTRTGTVTDQALRGAVKMVHDADPAYWADNPERWDAAMGLLRKSANTYADDMVKANELGALKGGKLLAAGKRDAVSDVIAPWADKVAKELSASRIADPETLARLAAAVDPRVTAASVTAGNPVIKLGTMGEIDLDTFKRVTATFGEEVPDKINAFTKHLQGVTNVFRSSALASPGFSNRNFVGGVLKGWANGVTLSDYRWAAKQYDAWESAARGVASKTTVDPAFAKFMERQGDVLHTLTRDVEANPFVGKVQRGMQTFQQYLDRTPISVRGAVTGTGTKVPTEVVLRGAAVRQGLRKGLTEEGAFAFSQHINFDYQDQSSFDVAAKKAVPFWNWTSRNLPAEAEMLARGQGVGSALEAAQLNSLGNGGSVPPWALGSSAALGGGKTLDLSVAPSTDLFGLLEGNKNLPSAARDVASGMGPAFSLPLQALTGRELATGRPTSLSRLAANAVPSLSYLGRAFPSAVPADLRSKSRPKNDALQQLINFGAPLTVREYRGG